MKRKQEIELLKLELLKCVDILNNPKNIEVLADSESRLHSCYENKAFPELSNLLHEIRRQYMMSKNMIAIMSDILKGEIHNTKRNEQNYLPKVKMGLPSFLAN